MPIDNTIFRDHFRLRERQRAERNAQLALINPSVPSIPAIPAANFDGPPDTRTRPRYLFRRGAISEASGQPNTPIIQRQQALAQPRSRIAPRSINQIATILDAFNGRTQLSSSPAYQRLLYFWRALANQIRRGVVTQSTPGLQATLNAAAVGLQNLTDSIRSRQGMEGNSRPHYRDTHRYGREGWWTAERAVASSQRPATIPGSTFAVPDATLNLFQSVDLFAPPPRRATLLEHADGVAVHVETYYHRLKSRFKHTVAARRRGADVPKGKLFTVSMELSRVRQLRAILAVEFNELQQAEREAYRRGSSQQNSTRCGHGGSTERSGNQQSPYLAAEYESSASEIDEPEGWSNLGFVFDGDYPEDVCFRVGSQELKYPIEEVESWMMNGQRRTRTARRLHTQARHGLYEMRPESQPRHRIRHTLAMPPTPPSRWLNHDTYFHNELEAFFRRGFDDEENTSDADYETFVGQGPNHEAEANEDHQDSENGGEGDLQHTDYEEEDDGEEYDEEDSDGEIEDLDSDGWGDFTPQALQAVESTESRGGGDLQIPGASAQAPIDLTGSPSIAGSQARSQNTSEESNRGTTASWELEGERELEAPHPVQGWTFDHSLFMFSCRGNIFDVTRQLQHAFGFDPGLSSHLVGQRLNGEFAPRHRGFVLTFLPGEGGTAMRAAGRDLLRQTSSANDDVYYGTQDVAEGDLRREDYMPPPLPGMSPTYWNRRLDACLLLDLNRGRFNFRSFWYRHREVLGGSFYQELWEFLAIRLAQVRYLRVTEAELSAAQGIGRHGQVD